VTVSASAADNVGVVGVQFKLDGVNLGAEVTTAPYSISWNTTTVSSGAHSVTAVARDAAGNTATSAAITLTVQPAQPTTVTVNGGSAAITMAAGATVTVGGQNGPGNPKDWRARDAE